MPIDLRKLGGFVGKNIEAAAIPSEQQAIDR
jgi:hypothetical protein